MHGKTFMIDSIITLEFIIPQLSEGAFKQSLLGTYPSLVAEEIYAAWLIP